MAEDVIAEESDEEVIPDKVSPMVERKSFVDRKSFKKDEVQVVKKVIIKTGLFFNTYLEAPSEAKNSATSPMNNRGSLLSPNNK